MIKEITVSTLPHNIAIGHGSGNVLLLYYGDESFSIKQWEDFKIVGDMLFAQEDK